jgi:tryptophan-rich sensory protein
MNIFFTIYIAVLLYILIPIIKIIWKDLLDKDLEFLLICNYILLFLLSFLFNNIYYLITNILLCFTLMIFSFLLIRKIKQINGYYSLLSIPYFIFIVYSFSYLLSLI